MSEIIARACGHTVEFTPKGDKYDEARREKLRKKNCPPCGVLKNKADNAANVAGKNGKVKKGQEPKALPLGIQVFLRLTEKGWEGVMAGNGTQVETVSAGAMGMLSKLARKWLAARGAKLTGQVKE